jgi:hypothetical protein
MRLLVRAVTSVDGINRMVYDVTSKPTGTIEPAGDNRRPVRRERRKYRVFGEHSSAFPSYLGSVKAALASVACSRSGSLPTAMTPLVLYTTAARTRIIPPWLFGLRRGMTFFSWLRFTVRVG